MKDPSTRRSPASSATRRPPRAGVLVGAATALILALGGGLPAADAPSASAPSSDWLTVVPELSICGLRDMIPIPGLRRQPTDPAAPGLPPTGGRPRPGSIFDPGAAGPGISQSGNENFLDGALDPRTGWPFVWLDHFEPRADRLANFWIVDTRDCPQDMGTDPWPKLKVQHFGPRGGLHQADPSELIAQVAGRPVLIQVQGSLTTPDAALGGLLWTHSWLGKARCLPADAVVIAFDWPSQRVYKSDVRDINEKGRRAYVAGFHLARFIQAFPPSSRVCLLGQSYGGRVVPAALHLLGGGMLDSQDRDPEVRLPGTTPDLHLRGIVIAGASDRNWLDPGQRFDHVLLGCEALLNLYNRKDEALRFYPFLIRSDHHRALGRVGLNNSDLESLGPLASRYSEKDMHDILKGEHSLLDAVANPKIARWMAPYLWSPDPGPTPEREEDPTTDLDRTRTNGGQRRGAFRR